MPSIDQIERRSLALAAGFLGLFSLALTLSPAARARSWDVVYRWDHWLGWLLWLVSMGLLHLFVVRTLPNRDPYLLPIAALLSGWGILTIWRLYPGYGLRQSIWLMVVTGVFIMIGRKPNLLPLLRQYKYLLLSGGLVLTALTLLMGTNPGGGSAPRLWLGCCGVYFQPSEPLKLLLVIYLSAYLADRKLSLALSQTQGSTNRNSRLSLLSLLAPTVFMTGLVLLILFVQRDLGTVCIFLLLYALIVYVATRRAEILMANVALLAIAGWVGYHYFDVVRLRVDAWLNPWLDPSGRSYQIVQSLLAIANGGLVGRGPGMGNPTLVPISHSDSIFAAIAEENGLVGVVALLILLALMVNRGLHVAIRVNDYFQHYLAFGLTVYLVIQSVLIIGGNIRLLPLTGVTLPFLSYGGTSLLTAWLALLFLLHISDHKEAGPLLKLSIQPLLHVNLFLMGALASIALITGWWAIYRGANLLERTDNARRSIAERYVKRGDILDRRDRPIATTQGEPGAYTRVYPYPQSGSVVGFDHPVYGQHGLEATLDSYLRGLEGYPDWMVAWNHLLYGEPPQGLDVRLSLDLDLQTLSDQLMKDHIGALVMVNAQSGEVLAMASHPAFDVNQLDRDWATLVADSRSPLLNRVIQGAYSPGTAMGLFFLARASEEGELPDLPDHFPVVVEGMRIECATEPNEANWGSAIGAGCPAPQLVLAQSLNEENVLHLYQDLGLYTAAKSSLPSETDSTPQAFQDSRWFYLGISAPHLEVKQALTVSPMQMVFAAATLSNEGVHPVPRLAVAVRTPQSDWTILPSLDRPFKVFRPEAVRSTVEALALQSLPIWQSLAVVPTQSDGNLTWYLGGTLPSWQGAPLTLVVVLEEKNSALAESIGQSMLAAAMRLSGNP